MKTRIILSLVMLLTVLSVKAQEPVETKIFPTNQIISPHKIEVTFQKTVHILFPSEVKYVDLGSFDIIFVLPKLTLPDDKLLVVEVYEKGGARHQSFRIENTDLVAAKPISELHLK